MKLFFEEYNSSIFSAADKAVKDFLNDYPDNDSKKVQRHAEFIAKNQYDEFIENLSDNILKALRVYNRSGLYK